VALESVGKALWADYKYLRVGIVSHRLTVWRLTKTHAATSPRAVIETASRIFPKDLEQFLPHFGRSVLYTWEYGLGARLEILIVFLMVAIRGRLVLSDCLEVAEAYLENGKT
jgi:hypothetical protein